MVAEPWWDQARCAEADTDVFYPKKSASPRKAKRYCAECVVREPCLRYALERKEQFGVWGGMTARQRRALSRSQAA